MRAPAWRRLHLALVCISATLLFPAAAPAQLGDLNVPDLEVPEVPESPVRPPQLPSTNEVVGGAEQATGLDVPELGGESPVPPPSSTPEQPTAEAPTSAPAAPESGGAAASSGSSSAPGSSPGSGPRSGSGDAGRDRDVRDGASRSDRRSARFSSSASATKAQSGEQASPVERVFDAIGGLPWTLFAAIAALAALGFAMAGRSALLSRRARRLANQGEELREDVGALQTALLPTIPERIGSVELSAAYRAAEGPAAGGDFHDVLPLGGERLAVIVGDVSGHGREALTLTALLHYTVRAYLEAGMQPREALRLADQAVGGKLGRDFATVLAAIYDAETSTLEYALAGHPAPIVLGEERDHAVPELTPPPIGVGPTTGFRQTRLALRAGSRVCFFTDGVIERRSSKGAMLGREGLALSLAEVEERITAEAALERVAGPGRGADDITVCLMRPRRAAGDGAVVEELELTAPIREGDVREFLASCGMDAAEADRAIDAISARTGTGSSLLRITRRGGSATWELAEADSRPPGGERDEQLTAVLTS